MGAGEQRKYLCGSYRSISGDSKVREGGTNPEAER